MPDRVTATSSLCPASKPVCPSMVKVFQDGPYLTLTSLSLSITRNASREYAARWV